MIDSVKLLDGGFSTQLLEHVNQVVDGDPLWTAKFLAASPHQCALVHRDFVKAGSDIITTGSYQSSIEGYKNYMGIDTDDAYEIIKSSVHLARKGITLAGKDQGEVKVAGSVGPYGACLHDGSEYTGSYSGRVTREELMGWHRPRVQALLEAGADLLAIETIPCSVEALALVHLLKEFPQAKAWLSFSIRDPEKISNGENFCEVALKCWQQSDQLVAIGANCFHPSLVTPLLLKLKTKHPQIPFIAYPNTGESYDASLARWSDDGKVNFSDYVQEWLDLGIKYLGGCCRTNDEVIKMFRKEVDDWKNSKNTTA